MTPTGTSPRRFAGFARAALIVLALPGLAGAALAQGMGGPGGGPGGVQGGGRPASVGVVTLNPVEVPYTRTLPGRAVAFEQTEIRPRVSGAVTEILYAAGQPLSAGDPMFRIEDVTYRAALTSAEAALSSAETDAAAAQTNVERLRSLQGRAATATDLQNAETALASANSRLASARAALEVARLDLERTTVLSPISGVASVPAVTIGALVTANQAAAMATVTRLDPIYVDVSDSSAGMLRIRENIASGLLTPGDSVGLQLMMETGEAYDREGTMVALGTEVSASTGTVDFRVSFDNPDQLILPGQFLRMNMTLGTMRALLVPQRATSRAADGALTAWVIRDGRLAKATLTTAGVHDNAWIVTAGLEPGEGVVVDGLSGLVEGREASAIPVEIDADGLVREIAATPSPDATAAAGAPQSAPVN